MLFRSEALRTGSAAAWAGVALAILLFGLMALGVRAWRARRLG